MSEETKKEALCDAIYELGSAKRILDYLLEPAKLKTVVDFETLQNLRMLLGIAEAKIDYYQGKYDFEVDLNDVFYPEDIAQFLVFHSKENNGQEEAEAE